eukprot:2963767-Rhodomonas_salina.3
MATGMIAESAPLRSRVHHAKSSTLRVDGPLRDHGNTGQSQHANGCASQVMIGIQLTCQDAAAAPRRPLPCHIRPKCGHRAPSTSPSRDSLPSLS